VPIEFADIGARIKKSNNLKKYLLSGAGGGGSGKLK
jgi:hypothetical protein